MPEAVAGAVAERLARPCRASTSRAAASMSNRDAPGRDRRDRQVVRLENRRVDLASPGCRPARPIRSGSGRRSMSRRRRRSPAPRGHLRSIVRSPGARAAARALGPLATIVSNAGALEAGLPDPPVDGERHVALASGRARTSADTRRGDARTAAAPPRAAWRSRTRPSARAPARRCRSVATSSGVRGRRRGERRASASDSGRR